jgi:hypothetical protein
MHRELPERLAEIASYLRELVDTRVDEEIDAIVESEAHTGEVPEDPEPFAGAEDENDLALDAEETPAEIDFANTIDEAVEFLRLFPMKRRASKMTAEPQSQWRFLPPMQYKCDAQGRLLGIHFPRADFFICTNQQIEDVPASAWCTFITSSSDPTEKRLIEHNPDLQASLTRMIDSFIQDEGQWPHDVTNALADHVDQLIEEEKAWRNASLRLGEAILAHSDTRVSKLSAIAAQLRDIYV